MKQLHDAHVKCAQKTANKIARASCYLRATKIVFTGENKIKESTRFGYRKNTTGEYVPNAYRSHFGWKNTYYQPAVVVVSI